MACETSDHLLPSETLSALGFWDTLSPGPPSACEWLFLSLLCLIPCLSLESQICTSVHRKDCLENYIGIFAFPWIIIGQNTTLKKSGPSRTFFKRMSVPEHSQDKKPLYPWGSSRVDILQLLPILFFIFLTFNPCRFFFKLTEHLLDLYNSGQFRIEMDGAAFNYFVT